LDALLQEVINEQENRINSIRKLRTGNQYRNSIANFSG